MAVTKNNQSSVLKLIVSTPDSENSEKTTTRTINKINPELTDEMALSLGKKIGDLQAHPVEFVNRVDTAALTNEPEA